MFLKINQLIKQAGLSGLNLRITPNGDAGLHVVMTTERGGTPPKDPKLASALSGPLCLTAPPVELDAMYWKHFDRYSSAYVEASLVANTEDAAKALAESAEPHKKAKTALQQQTESPEPATEPEAVFISDMTDVEEI